MRIIKVLLLLLFLAGSQFYGDAQSTQIIVFLNDGTEQTYNLSEADRLYFEDNTKLVIEEVATKSAVTIPLADIRKITCEEYVGTEENYNPDVTVYPNPVHNTMTFHNLNGKETIRIYALDGRLLKSFEISGSQTIDISDLSIGLYLVKTQSCTLKMIKL